MSYYSDKCRKKLVSCPRMMRFCKVSDCKNIGQDSTLIIPKLLNFALTEGLLRDPHDPVGGGAEEAVLEVDGRPLDAVLRRALLAEGNAMHLEDVAVVRDHGVRLHRVALLRDHHGLREE